jgi:predicted nucleic acid-binding protein
VTTLAFDTSPLSHFARAELLPELEMLIAEDECVVVQAVADEIKAGIAKHPELSEVSALPWLTEVRVDGLPELRLFAQYARLLGSGSRDIGEAATLAWAECNGATAIVDERAGTRHARQRDVDVHGTLWLIARGLQTGAVDVRMAEDLVDRLNDTEAWFPCGGATFLKWARENALL